MDMKKRFNDKAAYVEQAEVFEQRTERTRIRQRGSVRSSRVSICKPGIRGIRLGQVVRSGLVTRDSSKQVTVSKRGAGWWQSGVTLKHTLGRYTRRECQNAEGGGDSWKQE